MIPGTLEAITFLGSSALSAWQTIASQRRQDDKDRAEREERRNERQLAALTAARDYVPPVQEGQRKRFKSRTYILSGREFGWRAELNEEGLVSRESGFHFTRRLIALFVVFVAFGGPMLLPALLPNLSIAYGYPETVTGFFGGETEQIRWLILGSGERTVFIAPFVSLTISAIVGLFFGNQFTKRK